MGNATSNVDFDPVQVLGCTEAEAEALLRGRRVTPGEVETIALSHYQWWRHLRDPHSYWLTTSQAARVLHASPSTVRRMLEQGALPYVVHASGMWLMRRHEIVERARQGSAAGI